MLRLRPSSRPVFAPPFPHSSEQPVSTSASPTDAAPPAAPQASVWEDFIDSFCAPPQVVARRQAGGFGLPLLVFTVVAVLLYYLTKPLLEPVFDAEFQRQMAAVMKKNPQIKPEQLGQMRAMGDKFGLIAVAFIMPITALLLGFVTWLVSKLFDAKETVGAATMIATYALFPRLIQQVVHGLQGLVLAPEQMRSMYSVTLSPARFFDPDTVSPFVLALAGRVDLFVIWSTVLIAIGLHIIGKIPKDRAYIAAAIVWVCGAIPPLGQAVQQG